MSDDKLYDAASKGAHAQQFLEDDTFRNAFETMKAGLISRWQDSAALTPEDRERLWLCVTLLDKLKATIANVVSNGRVAQAEIDMLVAKDKAA